MIKNQSMEPAPVLYAVYGTLRKGFGNHRLLDNEHCTLLGTQRVNGFKMVSLGGYPGLIPVEGKSDEVTIEVYSVKSPKVEQQLDWLEGYPRFYGKMEVNTKWGVANVYILTEVEYGKNTLVTNGDWKEHIELRRKTAQ